MDLRLAPSQPGAAPPIQDPVVQPAVPPTPDIDSLMPIITADDPPQPNAVAQWFASVVFGVEPPPGEAQVADLFRQLAQACPALDPDRRVLVYQGLAVALGAPEMEDGEIEVFIDELIRAAPDMPEGALADAAEALALALGAASMSDDKLLTITQHLDVRQPTRALMSDLACGLCRSAGASPVAMHGRLLARLADHEQPQNLDERYGFVEGMARGLGGAAIETNTFEWLVGELMPELAQAELRGVQDMVEMLGKAVGGVGLRDALNEAFYTVLDEALTLHLLTEEDGDAAREGWLRARGVPAVAAPGMQEDAGGHPPESKHESTGPAPAEKKHAPRRTGD